MSQHWMLVHTANKERALGHANVGGYSNIRLDAYLDEAMMDDERDMTEDERREARATLERAMLQIPRFNREMFWFVVILLVLAPIYNL